MCVRVCVTCDVCVCVCVCVWCVWTTTTCVNNNMCVCRRVVVGGANASLTGLEAASGFIRTAGGTAMNVAEKIGAHVNEITKEREKHRTNVDETYYKSEMTGGSLADAMRGVGGGGSGGGMSGPWGRSEDEEVVVAKAAERKVEQTPSPSPPPPPTTSSSDPLGISSEWRRIVVLFHRRCTKKNKSI